MSRYKKNRMLPIVLIVVIVIIAIAAIVSLGSAMFGGGDDDEREEAAQSRVEETREHLLNTEVNRSVRATVRGPIVGDEMFHSWRIVVTPRERVMTTHQGYLAGELESVRLGNNTPAYDEFVHALNLANLPVGEAFEGEADNTRGVCAHGRLFEFEILEGSETIKRLWTTTCSESPGSLYANSEQLTRLFIDQIPDGRDHARDVGLNV